MSDDNLQWQSPRTLVLCFDGTGNLFDDTNTNVVKLFAMLRKDNKDEQLVYYQAGIGTYSAPGIVAGFQLWFAKLLDKAVAWYLDAHVMGGYQFLMQNYRTGDRICLFGFSRGAYTARALAGMLYKVGLLPRDNIEQIGFAYQMYKATGDSTLADGFKSTFCRAVQVEFMGCWDTVSSVGLFWGRHLPFSSSNTSIKVFRHALSLDERRVKFQPNLWHIPAPDDLSAIKDPEHSSQPRKDKPPPTKKKSSEGKRSASPPDKPDTDVLEVWFAGCHSDVGGGELPSAEQCSLSNITLRWMVREIMASKCKVQFDNAALEREGLAAEASVVLSTGKDDGDGASAAGASAASVGLSDDAHDALQPLHDQLVKMPLWWILEVIPLVVSWQDNEGRWHRAFRWNLGRGRTIDMTSPNLHTSVQTRMADTALAYVPRANWADKPNGTWVP